MSKILKKIKTISLDLLFPKNCLGCNQSNTYLCPNCFNKIDLYPKITKNIYLDKIISATEYRKPIIQEIIKKFKYQYVKELAVPLSRLLIKSLEPLSAISSLSTISTILIPIPLYKFREHKRGYNQAEILAKEIAKHFNLPIKTDIVKRIIPTEPQADIKDDEKRKENIKGVFALNSEQSVEGKTIILVDDVITTGATLSEAAKILKQNGVREVWALVVARG